MTSRLQKGDAESGERPSVKSASSSVVNIGDARRGAGVRVNTASFDQQLEETRELLDRGLPSAAEARLRHIISSAKRDPAALSRARRLLSVTLEMLGRYGDALEVVQMYEPADSAGALDAETFAAVRVQLGLAYNYTGDHPKAIAILNAELRAATERGGSDSLLGEIYAALARVYRSINEYSIARDHSNKTLEYYRGTGDWRGIAEAYFGVANADSHEGHYERTLESFEQAIQLVGERPAPALLGRIYNNIAGAYWFLKRPHDGIRALEKAVTYYETTENKDNAATGFNNLGTILMLIGEWDRAHAALKRALELAMEIDENAAPTSMIFDSLGELRMYRGELDGARTYLERAIEAATRSGRNWYTAQAMRTTTRCYIALGLTEKSLEMGERALALAERIGDRQAVCESNLLLAEARLLHGEAEECAALLEKVSAEVADSATDIAVAGEAQRVYGLLALEQKDATLAAHHFGRCLSISELIGDRYRTARAHYLLGRAYAIAQPARAAEHLGLAVHTFRELGAKLDLEHAEEFLEDFESHAPEEQLSEPPAPAQLLTLRLAEAVTSRELLLRELATVVHQETRAARVLIAEAGEDGHTKVVIAHGFTNADAARAVAAIERATTEEE